MSTSHAFLVVAAVFAMSCLAVGCAPAERRDVTTAWVASATHRALREDVKLFSDDQLVLMVGEPDKVVRVGDFPGVLADRWGLQDDAEYIETTMGRIYLGYSRYMDKRRPDVKLPQEWRNSQEFAECQLWLYHWDQPLRKMVSGLLRPRTFGEESDCFLVRDGTVLWSSSVLHVPDSTNSK